MQSVKYFHDESRIVHREAALQQAALIFVVKLRTFDNEKHLNFCSYRNLVHRSLVQCWMLKVFCPGLFNIKIAVFFAKDCKQLLYYVCSNYHILSYML